MMVNNMVNNIDEKMRLIRWREKSPERILFFRLTRKPLVYERNGSSCLPTNQLSTASFAYITFADSSMM